MAIHPSASVHPSAILSDEAEIGPNVQIGARVIIEGQVTVGPDCVLRPSAMLLGPLTMGRGNVVHSYAVLGDRPQHLRYKDEPTWTEIGDGNIFREHVTVHRGTTHSMKTAIGDNNFFMVSSHVAHDCVIGNRCTFVNGSLLGGHCIISDNVILSGNSGVHQFVRVGRLAMIAGLSASNKDVPPFVIQQQIDNVVGINVVGLKRAGFTSDQMLAVRRAFRILFREGLPLSAATAKLDRDLGTVDVVREILDFLGGCKKGINPMRGRWNDAA